MGLFRFAEPHMCNNTTTHLSDLRPMKSQFSSDTKLRAGSAYLRSAKITVARKNSYVNKKLARIEIIGYALHTSERALFVATVL